MSVVSIVTFNNEDTIKACVKGILDFDDTSIEKIVVFDNGSTDSTLRILLDLGKAYANRLELIQSSENLGFGRAHNQVFSRFPSGGTFFIVNPDISFKENVFSSLEKTLFAEDNVGLLVPRLLNPDDSLQPQNKRYPTVLDLILRKLPKYFHKYFTTRMSNYVCLDKNYDQPFDVEAISGAFIAIKSWVFREINGFDDRYFLYFEDVDLGRKVQDLGLRTVYTPEQAVYHKWNRAAHKSTRMALVLLTNAARYFHKWGWKLK